MYGTLGKDEPAFHERTPFAPNSPYAASKAASDHLVRAWHHTYDLPALITNCSNNYGPYQFPEKLIPLTIFQAIAGKPLPVYGDGQQIRDCLFVEDHCSAIEARPYAEQIQFVTDRPGHDRRYAIDATKIQTELQWYPAQDFASGLRRTVEWYLANQQWVADVTSGAYREWIATNYDQRASIVENVEQ